MGSEQMPAARRDCGCTGCTQKRLFAGKRGPLGRVSLTVGGSAGRPAAPLPAKLPTAAHLPPSGHPSWHRVATLPAGILLLALEISKVGTGPGVCRKRQEHFEKAAAPTRRSADKTIQLNCSLNTLQPGGVVDATEAPSKQQHPCPPLLQRSSHPYPAVSNSTNFHALQGLARALVVAAVLVASGARTRARGSLQGERGSRLIPISAFMATQTTPRPRVHVVNGTAQRRSTKWQRLQPCGSSSGPPYRFAGALIACRGLGVEITNR